MTPRDDDEKRTGDPGPPTGGSDLGADWLMSQLDDTGVHSTIDDDTDSSPHEQQQNSRGSRRRRFRRRSEPTDAAESGAPADGAAPTQAFDEAADRSTTPPSRTSDGIFTWGLTPNSDVDPLVAGNEAQSGTTPPSPDRGTDAVSGSAADSTAGEPTQAFDPFADHEPDPVAPEQAAADAVFAQPGAYDRLYDEATLSSLDGDDDDEEDAAGEPRAAGLPVPKPAVTDAPGAVIPPPVSASDVDGAPSGEDAVFAEDTEFADDEERAEAEEIAEEAGVPLEAESATSPDLGILDLFGTSRRGRTPDPVLEPEDTGPITPEPAALTGTGDAERTSSESETSARLRALFESTATAPHAVQPPAPESQPRSPGAARGSGGSGRSGSSGGGSRGRSPLVLAGIVVAAVVVLGGLFWAGTLIPGMVSASPPQASDTSTPAPTPSLPAEGTLPAGTYAWDQLRGGECLTGYSSPWAEEFTVVACEEEHDAQLLAVDTMGDEDAAFPGEDDLASQIYLLCSDPSVIDLGAAGEYGDVQVQGSYPVTEEQWNDGQRSYYCFADRSSGDPLSGTLVPAE